jgi:enoyl-CoA hydratase
MEFKTVLYEKNEHVARIILNRPEVLNAMSWPMIYDLDAALTEAEKDDDVRVIIFKGAGRAFSAGYDLSDKVVPGGDYAYRLAETKPGEEPPPKASQRIRLRLDREWMERWKHLFNCSKVTIAQAHGYCLAMGLMFVEKCDLIIGAEDCKFGYVEERLLCGGSTMSPMLIARVGLTKALELQLTGKMIDGKEAARINLINRAVPADELETEVDKLARAIALYPRDMLALGNAARNTVYETSGMNQWFTIGAYLPHVLINYIEFGPDDYHFDKDLYDKGVRRAAHEKEDQLKKLGLLEVLDK